uniref:Uncharacterized protein n=1 Tax=Oryza meridionalis TaxID=40149 RepID=A0A0E0DX71_9ORYZ
MQAKKTLRCLKGVKRLHIIGQTNPVNKHTAPTLNYIESWNKQRYFMVTKGRNRKKQENQMKVEQNSKICRSNGMEARILWRKYLGGSNKGKRPHGEQGLPQVLETSTNEVGKGGWGWSWMDQWIAARPWEPQSLVHPENPKKGQAKKENASTNPSALKQQGSITPKKKSSPSPPDQKKPVAPSPPDQKKPVAPSPPDQKNPVARVQKAKAAGPPKAKPKDMKGGQEKKQQQLEVPSLSA